MTDAATGDEAAADAPGATSAASATGAAQPGAALLDLQSADLAIDALRAARAGLPERHELPVIESEAAELELLARRLEADREQRRGHERALSASAGELAARIALIESQVRSGRVSYRDQEALADELASLAHRRDALEDEELGELTALDQLEEEAGRIAAQRPLLVARHRAAQAALVRAEGELDRRVAEALEARERLAAAVPPALLSEYERLRQRLGGAVVARVVRNSCDGCHLTLPATEADRLRHAGPGSTARCEQCGRLLVA
jgi:predicted  nucleic acid-binding Zn-ribbon protein